MAFIVKYITNTFTSASVVYFIIFPWRWLTTKSKCPIKITCFGY